MTTCLVTPEQTQPSIIDDVVEACLEGWSGLRLYLERRRAGEPVDRTMEVLLREVLRVRLGESADIPVLMKRIVPSKL